MGKVVARPAQGHNPTATPSPRPAYRADAAPVIKSRGTVSRPHDTGPWHLKRLVADATPRVIK